LPISCCAVTTMPSATTACPTTTQAFAGLTMNEVTVAVVLSVDGGLAASAHWHLLEGAEGLSSAVLARAGKRTPNSHEAHQDPKSQPHSCRPASRQRNRGRAQRTSSFRGCAPRRVSRAGLSVARNGAGYPGSPARNRCALCRPSCWSAVMNPARRSSLLARSRGALPYLDVPVAAAEPVGPLVDLADEVQLLLKRQVARQLVAPVGDGGDGGRLTSAGQRVDADHPNLLGVGVGNSRTGGFWLNRPSQ
jgi:hypothetical protein